MSPVTRTVAASTKAHSRRCASATAASTGRAHRPTVEWSVEGPDRADLDPAGRRRDLLGQGEGLVEVGRFYEVVATERLLGLGEGAVGDAKPPDGS